MFKSLTSSRALLAASTLACILSATLSGPVQAKFKVSKAPIKPALTRPEVAVNLRDITAVEFGLADRQLGIYRQVSPSQWTETSTADGSTTRFVEVDRRDGAIYLLDGARGVHLQLDLRSRAVFLSNSESGRRMLYSIISASTAPIEALAVPSVEVKTAQAPVLAPAANQPLIQALGTPAPAPVSPPQQCRDQVQGQVAWNHRGDVRWADTNLARLCQGSTDAAATIACFKAELSAKDQWESAIVMCGETTKHLRDRINGANVTGLEFGQNGAKMGEYRQVGPKAWVETGLNGAVQFRFQEVQRDDWSVYLADPSRGVQVQLDLYKRKVLYGQNGAPRGELYSILTANAMAVLPSGTSATPPLAPAPRAPDLAQQCIEAVQGKVAWNRRGSTQWQAGNLDKLCRGTTNPSATIACFQREIQAHDQWAEALKVCSQPGIGAEPSPPVQPVLTGRNVVAVEFGQAGRTLGAYRQVGARQWVEAKVNGEVSFRFDEAGRDDWSVYLVDKTRGVEIQLDLYRRKVLHGANGGARSDLYDILGSR